MMIDRDLVIDTLNNVSQFRDQGLPVETFWNGHLAANFPSWIDPKSDELGEGAKYFKYEPSEAKKLINAAGHQSISLVYHYYTLRPAAAKLNEVLAWMMRDKGFFNIEIQILDYSTDWREVCQRSAGEAYNGLCYDHCDGFNEDAFLVAKYTPTGKFTVSKRPVPEITDLAGC